jgi:glycosyl transferase family 87
VTEPAPPLRVVEGSGPRPDLVTPALELAALGSGLTLTAVLMGRMPSWFQNLGRFQMLYATAFAFYALALAMHRRWATLPGVGLAVFAVALATRVALLPASPSLSGDVYRYAWEGRVAAHGRDPYRLSPSDPALEPLRDDVVWPRVNHPGLATIYPPLAIAGFALVSRVSDTVVAFKLWVVLHDLALVAVLLAWSRRLRVGPAAVIAYAWNPLVLVEHAGSGHNEPTALLWLVVALATAERRPLASALALAAGVLTKLTPVLAIPILWRRWPWRARLTALALTVAGLGAYLALSQGATSGLAAYWRQWRNNEALFGVLERLSGSFEAARLLAIVVIAAVVAWVVARRIEPVRGSQLAIRAATIVSPVVHPWYLGTSLVFEPFTRSAPWLLLSLLAILNYGVLATPAEGHDHHPSVAVRWIEYGLPLALAAALALRARGVARRAPLVAGGGR